MAFLFPQTSRDPGSPRLRTLRRDVGTLWCYFKTSRSWFHPSVPCHEVSILDSSLCLSATSDLCSNIPVFSAWQSSAFLPHSVTLSHKHVTSKQVTLLSKLWWPCPRDAYEHLGAEEANVQIVSLQCSVRLNNSPKLLALSRSF
jgi:hypothetical protein